MRFYEVLLTGIALSADAFAVAVCIGLMLTGRRRLVAALTAGLYFGVFQAVMPLAGFYAASLLPESFAQIGSYAACAVLALIGGKMLLDSCKPEADRPPPSLSPPRMLVLAVATSIDALVVGAGFAFLDVNILTAAPTIGATTLIIASCGVYIGAAVGGKMKNKAEILGGVILIVIGIKIFIESLA